ncbi:MAG: divergent polysaccharide deacetylase family protein [Rhodobacteraceae bacterium]|nr:divergent polysaccharide deacetylase family protein [Paracoccaceae bacterium]
MSGGFGAGFLKGALISLIAAAAVSLLVPLKIPDPSRNTQVELATPAGSGFNAARTDSAPELPRTDQSRGQTGELPKPLAEAPPASAPGIDQSPASQPQAQIEGQTSTLTQPEATGGENTPQGVEPPQDIAPKGKKPALGMPTPVIENPLDRVVVNRLPSIEAPPSEAEALPVITTANRGDTSPERATGSGLANGSGPGEAPLPQSSPLPSIVPPPPTIRSADDTTPEAAPGTAAKTGPETATETAPAPAPTATIIARTQPPAVKTDPRPDIGGLRQHRIPPATRPDKPLMSIILLDIGDAGLPQDTLLTFTIPVTFALDPDNAATKARALRFTAKGFEVLALTPDGADKLQTAENETDMDAALSAVFADVPGAVGLIDRPAAELQKDAQLADQVINSLTRSGYGLLSYDIGLNATDHKANRAGVPASTVFRILDGNGESAITIKRYLDRAALEAGKVGHVVVLGHSNPQTVTALYSWALSSKSATVSLVPVSSVLLTD